MKWRVLENQISPGHFYYTYGPDERIEHYKEGGMRKDFNPPPLRDLPYRMRLACDIDEEGSYDYILIACDDISSQVAFDPQDYFEDIYGVVMTEVYQEEEDKWEVL